MSALRLGGFALKIFGVVPIMPHFEIGRMRGGC